MGASNVSAAFQRYAGKVPPLSMTLLTYMANVSKDSDEWPFFRLGQFALAEMALGRPDPDANDLRAVQRGMKPLLDIGAVTVDRSGAVRADGNVTARYRLNLTDRHDEARRKWEGTPDGKRRMSDRRRDRQHPTKSGAHTRRKVTSHPTKSDVTYDGKRRPQETVGIPEEREDQGRSGSSTTTSHPPRASTADVIPIADRRSRHREQGRAEIAAKGAAVRAALEARYARKEMP